MTFIEDPSVTVVDVAKRLNLTPDEVKAEAAALLVWIGNMSRRCRPGTRMRWLVVQPATILSIRRRGIRIRSRCSVGRPNVRMFAARLLMRRGSLMSKRGGITAQRRIRPMSGPRGHGGI
jgi:hypothetical protein